jgi:hypothetical protein
VKDDIKKAFQEAIAKRAEAEAKAQTTSEKAAAEVQQFKSD